MSSDYHLQRSYKRGAIRHRTKEEFVSLAQLKHSGKYSYEKCEYVDSITKIEITCPAHGGFLQRPAHHLMGSGCRKCANDRIRAAKLGKERGSSPKRLSQHDFVERSIAVHGTRYDYSLSKYETNSTPLIIICETHGQFQKRPDLHWAGSGCCLCDKHKQSSTKCDKWLDKLRIPVREYRLPEAKLRVVDGYDPATRTVYQYHGDFWHGNPGIFCADDTNPVTKETFGEAYARTTRLDRQIVELGYNLVVRWETVTDGPSELDR